MKTNQPKLTKDQRKRLFLLARLLDRVPKKHFKMRHWIKQRGTPGWSLDDLKSGTTLHSCGTTACACGWALTIPSINRLAHSNAANVASSAFGMSDHTERVLFGYERRVGPRRVASDIRSYLKDGTLPANRLIP